MSGSVAVASRLARREVRRHPWRHLLVAVLIFLPVLAALGCFTAIASWQDVSARDSSFHNPSGGALRSYGDRPDPDGNGVVTPENLGLPAGTRIETAWVGADWLVTDAERPVRRTETGTWSTRRSA